MSSKTRSRANREYAEQFENAARIACTVYLDGLGAWGDVRRHQEYDNLTPEGQVVWRAVAMRAARAMPDDPDSEVARLRARVAELEAETQWGVSLNGEVLWTYRNETQARAEHGSSWPGDRQLHRRSVGPWVEVAE